MEITLSQERWDQLEAARGHEPRASFIKRALDFALDDERVRSPADIAAIKKVWDSPALMEQMLEETPDLVPPKTHPNGFVERQRNWRDVAQPLPPGVKTARELAMERQRRMNERKS